MKIKILLVKRTGQIGMPWHYYHFLSDVVIPFFKHSKGIRKKITDAYMQDIPQQSIGPFVLHFKELYNIQVHLVSPNEFKQLSIPLLKLDSVVTSPPSKKTYNLLYRFLKENGIYDPSYPKIILIERGVQKNVPFQNRFKNKFSGQTGVERRSIINHDKLRKAVLQLPNSANLILEDIPFMEQIKYFYNAKIVIGQHGAGLTNTFWMPKGKVIELSSDNVREISGRNRSWWKQRNQLKNKNLIWKNFIYPDKDDNIIVNPKEIIDYIKNS